MERVCIVLLCNKNNKDKPESFAGSNSLIGPFGEISQNKIPPASKLNCQLFPQLTTTAMHL
jgi:hypothetical protein